MARIRSIKPETWVSEQVAECSVHARLTFIGMWNFCDDNGVHPAKPKTLKAELYPMDEFTAVQVGEWVAELVKVGLVREFVAQEDGERYWHVTGWAKHQKIDKPSCKYPAPPGHQKSTTPRRVLDESSSNAHRAPPPGVDGSGVDGKGVERSSPTSSAPPTSSAKRKTAIPNNFGISDRVRTWADEKGYGQLEAHLEAFVSKAKAKDYRNVDWDEAFMGAIRNNWAGLRVPGGPDHRNPLHADDNLAEVA